MVFLLYTFFFNHYPYAPLYFEKGRNYSAMLKSQIILLQEALKTSFND